MRPACRLILAFVVALTLVGMAPSAWAHTQVVADVAPTATAIAPVPAPVASAAETASAIPSAWLLVLAMAAAILTAVASWATPRQALTVVLVLALGTFAYATGLHSVHHLSTEHARADCVLAVAGAHVAGVEAQPPSVEAPRPPARTELPPPEPSDLSSRAFRSAHGRAPPLFVA
jgi:hypothetical protein